MVRINLLNSIGYALTHVGQLHDDVADRHFQFLLTALYPDLKTGKYPVDPAAYSAMSDILIAYVSKTGAFEGPTYNSAQLLTIEYPVDSIEVIEHAREHVYKYLKLL